MLINKLVYHYANVSSIFHIAIYKVLNDVYEVSINVNGEIPSFAL